MLAVRGFFGILEMERVMVARRTDDDDGDEGLDHRGYPSCWCPEFVFWIANLAGAADECAGGGFALRTVCHCG